MKAAEPLRALSSTFAEQMITVIEPSTRSGNCKAAPARDVVEVAARSILDVLRERAGLVRAFLTQTANPRSPPTCAAFTKEQLAEETSRLVCAYLGLEPTIAICEDSPDLARTRTIAASR